MISIIGMAVRTPATNAVLPNAGDSGWYSSSASARSVIGIGSPTLASSSSRATPMLFVLHDFSGVFVHPLSTVRPAVIHESSRNRLPGTIFVFEDEHVLLISFIVVVIVNDRRCSHLVAAITSERPRTDNNRCPVPDFVVNNHVVVAKNGVFVVAEEYLRELHLICHFRSAK